MRKQSRQPVSTPERVNEPRRYSTTAMKRTKSSERRTLNIEMSIVRSERANHPTCSGVFIQLRIASDPNGRFSKERRVCSALTDEGKGLNYLLFFFLLEIIDQRPAVHVPKTKTNWMRTERKWREKRSKTIAICISYIYIYVYIFMYIYK